VSGCAVNNFAFKTCQTTDIFKNLVAEINANNIGNARNQMLREKLIFDLFTKPFDEFYGSSDAASKAWAGTFWSRLGFSYNQLGNISNNLETIWVPTEDEGFFQEDPDDPGSQIAVPTKISNPLKAKQLGIISHNSFSFSYIPSTSGLGLGNFYDGNTLLPQSYGLRSYGNFQTALNAGGSATDEAGGLSQNVIHILSDSQKLIADDFPALNGGNNYLVIESDIVKENAKDSNAPPTTIVGIVSTVNAENDMIFSQSDFSFTITESRLLTSIEVRIKNPDGTLVSDDVIGKNNGFIFQLEQPLQPANIPLQSF